jgi:hypothetical protein
MVNCSVCSHYGSYVVEFDDGRTILLQSDFDQVAFAVASGLLKAPENWDGSPSKLGEAWENFDMEDIDQCPEEYMENAEYESRE